MLGPNAEEMTARARADLRIGTPVAVVSDDVGGIAVSSEMISADRLGALRAISDTLDLVITARRAETLQARAYDGDIARLVLDTDMSFEHVHAITDPSFALRNPLMGPFPSRRDGNAAPQRLAVRLTRTARLLPSVVFASATADAVCDLAKANSLTLIDDKIMAQADDTALELTCVSSARVPLVVSKDAHVHVFRPNNGEEEHYAIEIGRPDRAQPVLSRLHSACFTGDLIGSLKCDCGPQLRAALEQISKTGSGVLLYLNQEGRGIGLANKMRAYSLQDQGYDTVEANHRLGFEDDERDFRIGAKILTSLGFSSVHLMTNNPGKVAGMNAAGVHVETRAPLIVGENAHNVKYLKTKAAKSGHIL